MVLMLSSAWVYSQWPEPPVKELKAASDAITAARDAEAGKYAPDLFKKTTRLYDSAMVHWQRENHRFILRRNYEKTRWFASEAAKTGMEAFAKASEKARSIHHTTAVTLEELENILANFKKIYSPLPLPKTLRENFNQAAMIISEAKLAREKSDFHIAEAKLEKAKKMLVASDRKARNLLEAYFSSLPRWREWVDEAISRSARQNSTAVIVDKMAHTCRIYRNGKVAGEYDAEFGPNWMSQKMHKGDQATPEGVYQVTQKKDKRKTMYYKALLLNYPNNEDRARYKNNLGDGKFSSRLDIGGSIEIHGHGGRGFHWTNGCVSLNNKDMDAIFSMVAEGTPVVIVGSLESLEKYLAHAKDKQTGE